MPVHPSCRCPDQPASSNLKAGPATKKGNGSEPSQHPKADDTGNPREHTPLRGSVGRPRARLWMKRCLISSPLPAVCRSGACTATSVITASLPLKSPRPGRANCLARPLKRRSNGPGVSNAMCSDTALSCIPPPLARRDHHRLLRSDNGRPGLLAPASDDDLLLPQVDVATVRVLWVVADHGQLPRAGCSVAARRRSGGRPGRGHSPRG